MIKKFEEFISEGVMTNTLKRFHTGEVRKEVFYSNKEIIHDFMESRGIKRYKILPDGSVNVDHKFVRIHSEDLIDGKLPFKFNLVTGDFNCSGIKLESLEGCPEKVGGAFYCENNNLKSLKGGPKEVDRSFFCQKNKLETLEGSPEKIGWTFDCSHNNLTSLKGCTKEIVFNFYCSYNQLTTLEGGPEKVGCGLPGSSNIYGGYECSNNKLTSLLGMAKTIGRYVDCTHNELISLEGCPEEIGGCFNCSYNDNLESLKGCPRQIETNGIFTCDERLVDEVKKYCETPHMKIDYPR